ncbi:MAG: glycosyltransferase [Nitrospiraceae bacterium]
MSGRALLISVVIPTYQAAATLARQLALLRGQEPALHEILVIDSASTDSSRDIAANFGANVVIIQKTQFDHGGTRTHAGRDCCNGDIVVFLTQDALPVDGQAIWNLTAPLREDSTCGAVFGRQVPYPDATLYAQHLRLFNYPATSYVRTYADRHRYGLKAAFCSNSFAAYRRSALESVGWFASGLGMAEDMHVCARMLQQGYTIRYVAEAAVYHSHNYTLQQDGKRYFDVGVFHRRQPWLLEDFGRPAGEGLRYVRSEMAFLWAQRKPWLIPASLLRAAVKLLSYQLGTYYEWLPQSVVRRLSMHGVSG